MEADRKQALQRLKGALASAAGSNVSDEASEALQSAVREVGRRSPLDLGDEVASALSQARRRLAGIAEARRLREVHESACAALREAVGSHDAPGCRGALKSLADTEAALSALSEDVAAVGELAAEAQGIIDAFEEEQRRAALRAERLAQLEAAVASRRAEECAEALAAAREAGVGPCPPMELARILAEPQQLHSALVSEGLEGVSCPAGHSELTVEDFAAAAAATAESMEEGQLRERAAELAGAIMRGHFLHTRRVEDGLCVAEARLLTVCSDRMDEVLEHFFQEKEQSTSERKSALEEVARRRTQEAVGAGKAQVAGEEESKREALRAEAEREVDGRIHQSREDTQQRITALATPLGVLEEVTQSGRGLQQRSQASNALSSALLALETALLGGRPSGVELAALQEAGGAADGFVPQILAQVPAETMARSSAPVPTEPQLQRSFQDQLGRLTAAALMPPPAGLLGSIGSKLVGRLLGSAYLLRAAEWNPDSPESPTKAAQHNLVALSRAAALAEGGDLRATLEALGELTGECRVQAQAWAEDARHALLLRQAARAVQAKACCLNAALL